MKVYDISQEVLTCTVYPGDPTPQRTILQSMEHGSLYNLSAVQMCVHNGTHIDAPAHFLNAGKTVDSIGLDAFVGMAYVAQHDGIVSAEDAAAIMDKAQAVDTGPPVGSSSKETRKFHWRRRRFLPAAMYCLWETSPRAWGRRMHLWQCIKLC